MTARIIINVIILVFFVAWLTGDIVIRTEDPNPDYEAMANCIAEYDYKHYNNNMMNNLVAALELCDE